MDGLNRLRMVEKIVPFDLMFNDLCGFLKISITIL